VKQWIIEFYENRFYSKGNGPRSDSLDINQATMFKSLAAAEKFYAKNICRLVKNYREVEVTLTPTGNDKAGQ